MVRSRLLLPLAALACSAALLAPAAAGAQSASCANTAVTPSPSNMAVVRTAVLCLLNAQRAAHGELSLHANPSLAHAAGNFSTAMVHEGFFNHVSPNGSTLVSRVHRTTYLQGARGWALAENIAYGTGGASTPQAIVTMWMHSAGHRANILNPRYRDIGIGAALGAPVQVSGASTAATYTTDFGQRTR
jgi:uncharacterized protein YkwD